MMRSFFNLTVLLCLVYPAYAPGWRNTGTEMTALKLVFNTLNKGDQDKLQKNVNENSFLKGYTRVQHTNVDMEVVEYYVRLSSYGTQIVVMLKATFSAFPPPVYSDTTTSDTEPSVNAETIAVYFGVPMEKVVMNNDRTEVLKYSIVHEHVGRPQIDDQTTAENRAMALGEPTSQWKLPKTLIVVDKEISPDGTTIITLEQASKLCKADGLGRIVEAVGVLLGCV